MRLLTDYQQFLTQMTYRNPGFIIPPQFPDDLRAKPEYVQKIKAYIEYGMSYLISHPHLKCSKSLESFLVDDDAVIFCEVASPSK